MRNAGRILHESSPRRGVARSQIRSRRPWCLKKFGCVVCIDDRLSMPEKALLWGRGITHRTCRRSYSPRGNRSSCSADSSSAASVAEDSEYSLGALTDRSRRSTWDLHQDCFFEKKTASVPRPCACVGLDASRPFTHDVLGLVSRPGTRASPFS